MSHVIFVVPYALEATLRFVRGTASLPGVRLGIISQEPAQKLPGDVLAKLSAHHKVGDVHDAGELVEAVRTIARRWNGQVDRLIAILEQLQVPLAEVRERLGIRGMDVEEAKNFRDKARMKERFRAAGLPCARHRLVHDTAAALAFASEVLPLVAKPPSGAGARDTQRIDTRDELLGWLRVVPATRERPVLLEELIVGEEHSLDTVTLHQRHVFHSISRYRPTPLEVMGNPLLQWCVVLPREIDGPEYDDIRRAGRRALDVLGMVTGLTHMEWFRRTDGSIAISEVAARPPGAQFTTLLSAAHDYDFYRGWSELLTFETFTPPAREYAAGALYLRGQGGGARVARIHGLDEAQRELGDLVLQAKLPELGQGRAQSYEGEGYVILRHPETRVVEDGLRRLAGLLRVEME